MSHTLAEAFQYASQYIRLAPLTFATGPTGGRASDPALSIGDWVRQTILAPPFNWRWNRSTVSFALSTGVQDYVQALSTFGWAEKASVTAGSSVTMTAPNPTSVSITSNVLVFTSAGFGGTTTFGAVVSFAGFTNAGLTFLNGTSGTVISSSATILAVAYSHANVGATNEVGGAATMKVTGSGTATELEIALMLGDDNSQNLPAHVAPIFDDGLGNITFRFLPVPEQAYTAKITWQKQAPSFSAISGTWDPIPDYMFHIYSQGVLAKAYEYLGDERWPFTMNLFLRQLLSFHGGLSESQQDIFINNRLVSQIGSQDASMRAQQRVASRGLQ
jgi:hypothetical protein